jgi:hypothetical protein
MVERGVLSNQTKGAKSNPMRASRYGRPIGRKNLKPSMTKFLESIDGVVGQDDANYLKDVLVGGARPILEKDIDIFLSVQLKALLPVLAREVEEGQLSKEASQRSSVVKELLTLRFNMEKAKGNDDGQNPTTYIQNIFISRGIDPGRLALLAGNEPRRLLGDVDPDQAEADSLGNLPSELSQRPLQISGGSEESANRVQLDNRERVPTYDYDDPEQEG